MSVKEKIRNEILENYLFTDEQSELINSDSFLDKGIIDSTGVMELIFFIEEAFGVQVKDSEMIPENLDSVDNIVHYIESKSVAQ